MGRVLTVSIALWWQAYDLDLDGDLDILISTYQCGPMYMMSDGTTAAPSFSTAVEWPYIKNHGLVGTNDGSVFGDFSGDSKLDLMGKPVFQGGVIRILSHQPSRAPS